MLLNLSFVEILNNQSRIIQFTVYLVPLISYPQ